MRWLWITLIIALVVFVGGYFLLKNSAPSNEYTIVTPNDSNIMTLTSQVFTHNGTIPEKYTCDGDDINPALSIVDIPKETQSLALILHDPDAPKDGGWTHWTVWNMSPTTQSIAENSVPKGAIEGVTDFEEPGYGGPCPPSGTHHYNFTLFALDETLTLDSKSTKSELEAELEGHILAKTTLTGLYSRE